MTKWWAYPIPPCTKAGMRSTITALDVLLSGISTRRKNVSYRVEVIDTWEMTITDAGVHSGKFRIPLPGKEYMAIRLIQV